MSENVIQSKSYEFALKIIRFYQRMKNDKEYILSKQLLRSGTSIGANVEEAIAAQTKKEFIAKMSIASKEARETSYWLRLIRDSELVHEHEVEDLLNESIELIKILTSIVKTSQEKAKKQV